MARLALALVALVLTGCAQVPMSGPVQPGDPAEADDFSSVRIAAQKPRPGATAEDNAQGFLDAMSAYDVGFGLAKQFLTGAAADRWELYPIVIYDSPVIDVADDGGVLFSAQKVAEIDVLGQYTAASPGTLLEVRMPMVSEAGELRIVEPPPGVLITTLDRDNDYSPYTTYFPSSADGVLVPDVVWLPGAGAGLPTLLAQALVNGPTARLGDAVKTAFPEGTGVTSVSLRAGGVAVVAMTGSIAEADPALQQAMAAQLAYTLRGLASGGVQITVEGNVLTIPGVSSPLDPGAFPASDPLLGRRDPAAYALVDDRLARVDPADGTITPVAGPLGVSTGGARSVAVDLGETLAATVSGNGRTVSTARIDDDEQAPRQAFTGVDVANPSWDRFGNLWVVDRTSPLGSVVYVVSPDGTGRDTPIQAPALEARRVVSFRVAPDGARAAVSVETEDGATRLLILRVVRGEDGVTLSGVADPAALRGQEAVGDVAWFDETQLAVIVTPPDGAAQPAIVAIDGSTVSPQVETGVASIAAYPQQPLMAASNDGSLRKLESAITWAALGPGRAVTYPG